MKSQFRITEEFYEKIKLLGHPTRPPARFEKAMMLHSENRIFRERVREARKLFSRFRKEKCYVACSGGKDSMAILGLAMDVLDEFIVFHWDHGRELMPRGIENEIIQNILAVISRKPGVKLVIRRLFKDKNSRVDYMLFYRAFFPELKRMTVEYKLETGFLGLRSEESATRRRKTTNGFEFNKLQGIPLYYPIKDWSWMDVYAYLHLMKIPYPRIYHAYGSLVGYGEARLVTFFDQEFDFLGNANIDGIVMPFFKNLGGDRVDDRMD